MQLTVRTILSRALQNVDHPDAEEPLALVLAATHGLLPAERALLLNGHALHQMHHGRYADAVSLLNEATRLHAAHDTRVDLQLRLNLCEALLFSSA